MWNDILGRFNETSKTLQKEDMDLAVAVYLIQSLKLYVNDIPDIFEDNERKAKAKTINFRIPRQQETRC